MHSLMIISLPSFLSFFLLPSSAILMYLLIYSTLPASTQFKPSEPAIKIAKKVLRRKDVRQTHNRKSRSRSRSKKNQKKNKNQKMRYSRSSRNLQISKPSTTMSIPTPDTYQPPSPSLVTSSHLVTRYIKPRQNTSRHRDLSTYRPSQYPGALGSLPSAQLITVNAVVYPMTTKPKATRARSVAFCHVLSAPTR